MHLRLTWLRSGMYNRGVFFRSSICNEGLQHQLAPWLYENELSVMVVALHAWHT